MEYLKTDPYKIMYKSFFLIGLGVLLILGACEKEDMGAPIIKEVRLTDPLKFDSTFTSAFPGGMIVIHGVNLNGVKTIYLNNSEVPFNPNYTTETSIIVDIPEAIPLKGKDSSLPNQIRVVTSGGEATYDFNFLSPPPVVALFKFDIPATVGKPLRIYGTNFYEIQKIVFQCGGQDIKVTDFTVNETYNIITVTVPQGGDIDGVIKVVAVSGIASGEYLAAPIPVIASVSNDLPIVGDSLIINGKNFDYVVKVVLPGNVEIPAKDLKISPLSDRIALKMPAVTTGGKLQVVCETITAEMDGFYDLTKVLYNYDNIGDWNWGGPNRTIEPSITIPAKAPLNTNGKFVRVSGKPGPWQYWWGNHVMTLKNWPTTISDDTPLSSLALRFNLYAAKEWTKGKFEVQLGDGKIKNLNYEPWKEGKIPTGKWIALTIPLSSFTGTFTTYGELKTSPLANGLGFYFKNASADTDIDVDLSFDDFRLVKK